MANTSAVTKLEALLDMLTSIDIDLAISACNDSFLIMRILRCPTTERFLKFLSGFSGGAGGGL